MFGKGLLARTLILCSGWITSIVAFYALLLNVGSLSGDIFVNMVFSTFCDFPGTIAMFFIINRYGMRSRVVIVVLYLLCQLEYNSSNNYAVLSLLFSHCSFFNIFEMWQTALEAFPFPTCLP